MDNQSQHQDLQYQEFVNLLKELFPSCNQYKIDARKAASFFCFSQASSFSMRYLKHGSRRVDPLLIQALKLLKRIKDLEKELLLEKAINEKLVNSIKEKE